VHLHECVQSLTSIPPSNVTVSSPDCANGEVAPFVGHNAFMRWKALQEAALVDPVDGKQKVWSEGNVSEDFDMAMRLHANGYIIRCVRFSFY
jgi:hypothetical protein